jgi:oligoendopeptidase F
MLQLTPNKFVKKIRRFFPKDFDITNWENVENEFKKLLDIPIASAENLVQLWEKVGELQFIIEEEMAWRYIRMTCDATNKEIEEKFNKFYTEIVCQAEIYEDQLKKKFYNNEYRKDLDEEKYALLNQVIANDIELFREENIKLQSEEQELANQFGSIFGGITVDFDGEEKTMAQMSVYYKKPDRNIREAAWKARYETFIEKKDQFNELFNKLVENRNKQAVNAGFDNFRDFKHKQMGRFTYAPEDLYKFHDAVEKCVVPFMKDLMEVRKEKLGIEKVKPWDTSVDLDGKILKPFTTTEDLIEKSMKVLANVKPEFGENLNMMYNSDLLDLENRKGKAPGGYNYPLEETGSSFIFMNTVGLQGDVSTLLHESGHALHTAKTRDIKFPIYKETPSEVAELASMTMELITMDYWNEYYDNEEDLKKAKRDQLENALAGLSWIVTVDAFQHWVYTHPNHTIKEREDFYMELLKRYDVGIDWSGFEDIRKNTWMNQLHIFEVPFYYIEYGMSQLGALAIYKNYRENPELAVRLYEEFLAKGYTIPVDKLYETAGIKFDFSYEYIKELVEFVKSELDNL